MIKFGKYLLFSFLFLASSAWGNELTVEVDRQIINENELLTVLIKYDELISSGSPDLSGFRKDFDVIDSGYPTQQQFIQNGTRTAFTSWKVTLTPKRTGILTIPSITFFGKQSAPIQIRVNVLSQQIKDQQDKYIIFDVSISKESTYVQEPILYFLKIYYASGINSPELIEGIDFPHSDFEKINERNFQANIKGVTYTVYEMTARITPLSSGTVTLKPLKMTAEYYQSRYSKPVRISQASLPLTVNVKPIPAAFPKGAEWLPAASLTLSERWSESPESALTGESYTRQIILEAEGTLAKQLPVITFPSVQGIKRYPDKPQLKDDFDDNTLKAKRIDSDAIVFTQTGKITLPEITLPWWNTQTDSLEIATIQAHTISISPNPEINTAPVQLQHKIEEQPVISQPANPTWQYLSIILLITNVISITLIIYLFLRTPKATSSEHAKKEIHTASSTHMHTLQKAITERDPKAFYNAYHALLASKQLNSDTIFNQLNDENKRIYDTILAHLYANKEKPKKDELHQLFSGLKSVIMTSNSKHSKIVLPNLN